MIMIVGNGPDDLKRNLILAALFERVRRAGAEPFLERVMSLAEYDGTEPAEEIARDRELDLMFASEVLSFEGTDDELIEKYATWLVQLAQDMEVENSDGTLSGDSQQPGVYSN